MLEVQRPINIGFSGISGWNVLKRVERNLLDGIRNSSQTQSNVSYFKSKITEVSAADLVDDFRMLSFVLKAGGLEGDINNKAFIKKVIESDLSDRNSFANRSSDKRYLRMARSISDIWAESAGGVDSYINHSVDLYVERSLQERILAGDNNLGLVLNARRELRNLAERNPSDKAFWYEALGNVPLRSVLEGALGLSTNYRKLDIDRQAEVFSNAARQQLKVGSGIEITRPEMIENIAKRYLARSAVILGGGYVSPYGVALAIFNFRRGGLM